MSLAAHLADTVDAHDASAISSVPSGNLAATDVQTALNELQTDIDTRALAGTVTQQTLADAASGVSITGLLFDSSIYHVAVVPYTIERRNSTTGYRQGGTMVVGFDVYSGTWALEDNVSFGSSGGTTGVALSCDATTAQATMTADTLGGAGYVGHILWGPVSTTVKET